jgi:hypothetical protein
LISILLLSTATKQTQWKEMLEAETLLTTSVKVIKIIYYNERGSERDYQAFV